MNSPQAARKGADGSGPSQVQSLGRRHPALRPGPCHLWRQCEPHGRDGAQPRVRRHPIPSPSPLSPLPSRHVLPSSCPLPEHTTLISRPRPPSSQFPDRQFPGFPRVCALSICTGGNVETVVFYWNATSFFRHQVLRRPRDGGLTGLLRRSHHRLPHPADRRRRF